MKTSTKYKVVDKLPGKAQLISVYAKEHDITPAYVYIKHTRGKADYEIINFQGINFVIPN